MTGWGLGSIKSQARLSLSCGDHANRTLCRFMSIFFLTAVHGAAPPRGGGARKTLRQKEDVEGVRVDGSREVG